MLCRVVFPTMALALVVCTACADRPREQHPADQPAAQPHADAGAGGGVVSALFTRLDADGDGVLTREETRAGFDAWYRQWDSANTGALSFELIYRGLNTVVPAEATAGGQVQNQATRPEDVAAMMAALPDRAPVAPRQSRKVLVLGRAVGFVHSSIPLAARTIDEMGRKTGAWSTTITYDAADVNEANLKHYDAIFLASTTGHFLDDPDDEAATSARRQALLDFVRGGKGLAGIHAATDSYHQDPAQPAGAGFNWALLTITLQLMAGDTNGDGRLSREEFTALADMWFDTGDPGSNGRIGEADFVRGYAALPPPVVPGMPQGPATELGPDTRVGTWPEFNTMLGAFFKWHWNDGHAIPVKIDEPDHPLNAPFSGQGYVIVDETYTFSRQTYSRRNLRVLTSIDYAQMSAEDRRKEQRPRDDGDHALSWIRREGNGRVFYQAHGHNETVYANGPLLAHVLAGMQYVLGDLEADDSPSASSAE